MDTFLFPLHIRQKTPVNPDFLDHRRAGRPRLLRGTEIGNGRMARRLFRCCGVSSLRAVAISLVPVTGPVQSAWGASLSGVQPTAIRLRQLLEWLVASSHSPRLSPTHL